MEYSPYAIDAGNLNSGYNAKHNPERDVMQINLKPGVLLLWRPGHPKEMEKRGLIVIPDGVQYNYVANCAKVIKAGPGCEIEVGQYVFWKFKSDNVDDMPQPIIHNFTDEVPVFYFLAEKHVLLSVGESVEPQEHELDENQRSQKGMHAVDDHKPDPGKITLQ